MKNDLGLKVNLDHLLIGILSVFFFILLLGSAKLFFPFLSDDHDEPVYLYQALNLLIGRFSEPVDHLSHFFITWFESVRGDRLIFKYTPVHAALLATGKLLFGSFEAAKAAMGMSGIGIFYFFFNEITQNKKAALIATLFVVFSPLYFFLALTYLSYVSFLNLVTLACLLILRGVRLLFPTYLALGGFFGGVSFFARPLDGILILGSLGISYVLFFRELPVRKKIRLVCWVAAGFIPMFGLTLYYNDWMTGSAFQFPFKQDPLDVFGFGMRRQHPSSEATFYGINEAFQTLGGSLFEVCNFVMGGPIACAVACLKFNVLQRNWIHRFLLMVLVSIPVAYFFFWGPLCVSALKPSLGPFYHLGMIVPISLFASENLMSLPIVNRGRHRQLSRLLIIMMIGYSAIVAFFVGKKNLDNTLRMTDLYQPITNKIFEKSLIFLPGLEGPFLLHPFAALINHPERGGAAVYAVNQGNRNFELFDAFKNRSFFRFDYLQDYREQSRIRTEIVPLEKLRCRSCRFKITVQEPDGSEYVEISFINSGKKVSFGYKGGSDQRMPKVNRRDFVFEISSGVLTVNSLLDQKSTSPVRLVEGFPLIVAVEARYRRFSDFRRTIHEARIFQRPSPVSDQDGQRVTEVIWPPESWYLEKSPQKTWIFTHIDSILKIRLLSQKDP